MEVAGVPVVLFLLACFTVINGANENGGKLSADPNLLSSSTTTESTVIDPKAYQRGKSQASTFTSSTTEEYTATDPKAFHGNKPSSDTITSSPVTDENGLVTSAVTAAPTAAVPKPPEPPKPPVIDVTKVNLTIKECGESLYEGTKIINGTDVTNVGEYPWMAVIGYTIGNIKKPVVWRCGGSLITYRYVLTAAHCLDPRRVKKKLPYKVSMVRFSDLDLDELQGDGASPQDVPVDEVTWHPQYDPVSQINDIGLIRLEEEVVFNALTLVPICLPPVGVEIPVSSGTNFVVAGWGATEFQQGGSYSGLTKLRQTTLKVYDLDDCKRKVASNSMSSKNIINDSIVCTMEPGTGTCQGDSGGPVMLFHRIPGGRAKMYVYGVISYGLGCAFTGWPSVNTRVPKFMQWISDKVEEMER